MLTLTGNGRLLQGVDEVIWDGVAPVALAESQAEALLRAHGVDRWYRVGLERVLVTTARWRRSTAHTDPSVASARKISRGEFDRAAAAPGSGASFTIRATSTTGSTAKLRTRSQRWVSTA